MTDLSISAVRQTLFSEPRQHSRLRIGSVVGLLVVSWLTAGLSGLAVGAVVGLVAFVVRPVITVGVAHAGLLVLIPELASVSSLLSVAAFELCLLGVLGSHATMDRPTLVLTGGFAVVLSMGVVAVFIWTDVFVTSMFLLAVVGILGYGIHRYERVSLGLVAVSSGSPQEDTP